MYSLSDPNVSAREGGKSQALTEAEAIAFLNTKSPIPVVSKEPQSLGGTFLSDNKRNAEGQEKMLADNAIARDYQFKFKAGDKVSVPMGPPGKEVIKNMMIKSSYIEDGKPRYSIYEPGKKDYVMWANESDISPRTSRTKAKPKTETNAAIAPSLPDKNPRLSNDRKKIVDSLSKSLDDAIADTQQSAKTIEEQRAINAVTEGILRLGSGKKSTGERMSDGLYRATYESVISSIEKLKGWKETSANQKKIDDAIAPLAELAKIRTNDTPEQPAIATDWTSLAKAEKQKEEAEMRRLQGAPDGLSPIKQPIKGRSIIQIQKQLDQQKIGLTLKKHYNSYRLTDKEDVSIADFGRIDTAVEYLNDPTALHNRQKFLANTRGHEVSHFVRSYEDPRSTGRLTTPTKYTTSFPVYRQQSPFGMNQARVKMLAGQERIPRKEARVILSAIYNGKILKESYNSIAEKNEIPENLIQLIKIALKQHPDLASEYPESVNAIKN